MALLFVLFSLLFLKLHFSSEVRTRIDAVAKTCYIWIALLFLIRAYQISS